ncbi:MAG: DUF4430 domain-containing protein [Coriobacteriales bacterium]|jgi:hypothetical protein|nr:DUF4430 domain-containing protein [Coriobacteriales bacterium]
MKLTKKTVLLGSLVALLVFGGLGLILTTAFAQPVPTPKASSAATEQSAKSATGADSQQASLASESGEDTAAANDPSGDGTAAGQQGSGDGGVISQADNSNYDNLGQANAPFSNGTGDSPATNPGAGAAPTQPAKQATCTLSISCSTILDNMDKLRPNKKPFVPSDGWIMTKRTVNFTPGENVFDVLKREVEASGIHMSFRWTPMYNSVYIEGINQLYEFDTGELSGWMYCVNDWYPNYGASVYELKDGDVIEWNYTCDLGNDLPGAAWALG